VTGEPGGGSRTVLLVTALISLRFTAASLGSGAPTPNLSLPLGIRSPVGLVVGRP
jgi:hypothetical protein